MNDDEKRRQELWEALFTASPINGYQMFRLRFVIGENCTVIADDEDIRRRQGLWEALFAASPINGYMTTLRIVSYQAALCDVMRATEMGERLKATIPDALGTWPHLERQVWN